MRLNTDTASKVVETINALGPQRARRLFGLVIGQCSCRGKALTSGWKAVGVRTEVQHQA